MSTVKLQRHDISILSPVRKKLSDTHYNQHVFAALHQVLMNFQQQILQDIRKSKFQMKKHFVSFIK